MSNDMMRRSNIAKPLLTEEEKTTSSFRRTHASSSRSVGRVGYLSSLFLSCILVSAVLVLNHPIDEENAENVKRLIDVALFKTNEQENTLKASPQISMQNRAGRDATSPSVSRNVQEKTVSDIKVLSIIGERHSQIDWTHDDLKRCFSHSLVVRKGLTRGPHWFQHDDRKEHEKTLVIAQFRNPYHWVDRLRQAPHHAPLHKNLDWETFLTTPWTAPRVGSDLTVRNKKNKQYERRGGSGEAPNNYCQEGFRYDEVTSCVKHPLGRSGGDGVPFEHSALYELRRDGSGLPYGSVLDLRRDKIRNFMVDVGEYPFVSSVVPVKYEDLLREGTEFLVKRVESLTGVTAECHPSSPKLYKKPRRMETDFVKWMSNYVDWDVEALIGYEKGVFPGSARQSDFVDLSKISVQ